MKTFDASGYAQCCFGKCKKIKPIADMQLIGKDMWRCKSHKAKTILKQTPAILVTNPEKDHVVFDPPKRKWHLNIKIEGTIEEAS